MALDTSRLGDANLRNRMSKFEQKIKELEVANAEILQLAVELIYVVKAMAEKGKDKELVARMDALISPQEPEQDSDEEKE